MLRKQVLEKTQSELQLRLELEKIKAELEKKNILENEVDKLRNELAKNNEMCEKTLKIMKLMKTYDLS